MATFSHSSGYRRSGKAGNRSSFNTAPRPLVLCGLSRQRIDPFVRYYIDRSIFGKLEEKSESLSKKDDSIIEKRLTKRKKIPRV